jgi:hypothetical protein
MRKSYFTKIVLVVLLLTGIHPSTARGARAGTIWPNPLLGTWANVDADRGGLLTVIIKASNGGVTVDVAEPTGHHASAYYSGPVPATLYSESVESPKAVAFRAPYKDSLVRTTTVGQIRGQYLEVQLFTEWTDGSERYDYHQAARMAKEPGTSKSVP